MALNTQAVEILDELGNISDELHSIWVDLYKIETKESLELRQRINAIDRRVLKVADKLDITKKITI